MQKFYKKTLIFIGVLIAGCLFIGIAYLFYDKVLSDNTEVVVSDELSMNFIDGYNVNANGEYSFSVTNNGSKEITYDITADNLRSFDSELRYNLISSDNNINIRNADLDEDRHILASNISITPNTTQNFTLTVTNNTITSFDLKVQKIDDLEEYFYSTILKNNKVVNNSLTKVGEETALNNEGLIEDADDFGLVYYFRGAIDNNYVRFADNLWRIVRINGDGTVKLVLDTATAELTNYHSDAKTFEELETTDIVASLNAYYDSNLKDYDDYIASSRFCIETLYTENTNERIYNPYTRLITNKIPTFNCLTNKYGSKIGLLSVDDVVYAGANFEDDNETFYLYNKSIENNWWTSSLAKASSSDYFPFSVTSSGKVVSNISGTLYRSLRPTISLIKKVTVSGNGTQDNPYIVNSLDEK